MPSLVIAHHVSFDHFFRLTIDTVTKATVTTMNNQTHPTEQAGHPQPTNEHDLNETTQNWLTQTGPTHVAVDITFKWDGQEGLHSTVSLEQQHVSLIGCTPLCD